MLVRDFIDAPVPFEEALNAVGDPHAWERALETGLKPDEQVVLARFGLLGLGSRGTDRIEVRVGEALRQQRGTVVEVQWQPRGEADWRPVMDGDVTLSALSGHLVHLEFNGRYLPVGRLSAAPADRIVQHRVVEYGLRLVLERFVSSLPQGVSRKTG